MFRNTASRMAPIGGGSTDIRSLIGSIVNFAKSKANHFGTAPCDGFVLKMHYVWTVYSYLAGFFFAWYNWYHRDMITCVSHFNAETQVRLDYINICLSYPYIEYEDGRRRYILFYRWIHWTYLILAGLNYIPRKASKSIENPKTKRLFEDMAKNSSNYDQVEVQVCDIATKYIINNFKTHNGLFYKYMFLNFLALGIDVFSLYFIDFVLQGRFIRYGFEAYPFERDPKTFTDYMSVMFPPFVSCELDKNTQLTAKRTEKLGCHLPFMELYEKLFLIQWLWLVILMFSTAAYIIFLWFMYVPKFQMHLLKPAKPVHGVQKVESTIGAVIKQCKIGDIYLLYRVRQHLSHSKFYELLTRLSNPDLFMPKSHLSNPELTYLEKSRQNSDSVRNRKPSQLDPPINPEYLQQIIRNPGVLQRPQNSQNQEAQQRTPLLNKNTSILIE